MVTKHISLSFVLRSNIVNKNNCGSRCVIVKHHQGKNFDSAQSAAQNTVTDVVARGASKFTNLQVDQHLQHT